MEKYQVRSAGQAPFKLVKGTEELGTLNYPNWYSTTKAEIQLTGHPEKMQLKAPGFWKNCLELWREENCMISSEIGWELSVAVYLNESQYQLRVKNLARGVFVLQNEKNEDLLHIDVSMDWLHAKAEFEIVVLRHPEMFSPEILLFLVHNCNYFLALSGNASFEASLAAAV